MLPADLEFHKIFIGNNSFPSRFPQNSSVPNKTMPMPTSMALPKGFDHIGKFIFSCFLNKNLEKISCYVGQFKLIKSNFFPVVGSS